MLAGLLFGCSLSPSYDAYIPADSVRNATALAADKAQCLKWAQQYREPLDLSSIGTAAVNGAGKNAAGAAVNPLVPVIGAAGAAGGQTLESLNILSDNRRKVYVSCLRGRAIRSRAYEVLEPE